MKLSDVVTFDDAVSAVEESNMAEITDFMRKSHDSDARSLVLEAAVGAKKFSSAPTTEDVLRLIKIACEKVDDVVLSFAGISAIGVLPVPDQKSLIPWIDFLKLKSKDMDVRRNALILARKLFP